MGTLNKYIFNQVLVAALMTVALFVFVLVLGNILKEVMGDLTAGRLSISFFLYIVALIIPGVIPYALPMGMLTGILLVFGRMSAQSEVVAMKACGRSIFAMAAPVFFIAICASIFSVAINFYYAPAASHAYKTALKNVIRANPLQFIQPGSFIKDFPGYVIYANSAEGKELVSFRIWELDKQGRAKISIQSERGILSYDDKNDEIVLTLKNGSAERSRGDDPENLRKPLPSARFDELLIKLPLNDIIGSMDKGSKRLKRMTFGELMHARENWHPRPIEKTTPELAYRDKIEVQLQIQKNIAMAFSIFSMVVLAVPLGIKASRTETFANLAIALALAMTYYIMTVVISWLEKYPTLRPDILIWLPNLIFQATGAILLWRASKN
jgi:lipopolysaccharide export system permease protein